MAKSLTSTAMIQRNREDGLTKETYGIYTDGFKWIFMHLDKKYKVRPYFPRNNNRSNLF